MDVVKVEQEKIESTQVLVRCCDVEGTIHTAGNTVARVHGKDGGTKMRQAECE